MRLTSIYAHFKLSQYYLFVAIANHFLCQQLNSVFTCPYKINRGAIWEYYGENVAGVAVATVTPSVCVFFFIQRVANFIHALINCAFMFRLLNFTTGLLLLCGFKFFAYILFISCLTPANCNNLCRRSLRSFQCWTRRIASNHAVFVFCCCCWCLIYLTKSLRIKLQWFLEWNASIS